MASLREYRLEQLDKLEKLRQLGINAYPASCQRDLDLATVSQKFDNLSGQTKWLAGRLMTIRQHGQITFLDLVDQSGGLQLIVRADGLTEVQSKDQQLRYQDIQLLTRGDFINAFGQIAKSQSGEISLEVQQLKLLAKVLRPLPLKLDDVGERRRRRYLDLAINSTIRQRFSRRSVFWQQTRDFLNRHNFQEINIPVLEHTTGGADAKAFMTHMDDLGEDLYLRISHELPLKRLLGGGYEKVYDIGPRFRNEHHSDEHLPEHVAMEFYWAYADWQQGLKLTEDLIRHTTQATFGRLKFSIGDFTVDLSKPWPHQNYADIMRTHYDIDIFKVDLKTVHQLLKSRKIEAQKTDNLGACIDKLFKQIRSTLQGPLWLVNLPTFMSPLAKQNPDDSQVVQRFQAIMAGTEVSNGFSELNDPVEQLKRMRDQQSLRHAGAEEAQMLDIDFVEMLEYGMPPACGSAYSERLFWLLEGVSARDGVPFPHLKADTSQTTRGIYPELFPET